MKKRIILSLLILIGLFTPVAAVYGAETQTGIVTGDDVNLRAEPGLDGRIISVLPQGVAVSIIEQTGDWHKVQLNDGQTGWIYSRFLKVKPLTKIVSRGLFIPVGGMIDFAKSFLGISYVYGGDSPQGFDCSGFTKYIYAKFGIILPHKADRQTAVGAEVPSMEELAPGDLVFFKTKGSKIINHVGIYLGDNRFIHASSGYGAVRISPLDSGYYYNCYAGGRRLKENSDSDEPEDQEGE
ncbi:MAG: NlpC/P60 family protein [Bacillota bacterium]